MPLQVESGHSPTLPVSIFAGLNGFWKPNRKNRETPTLCASAVWHTHLATVLSVHSTYKHKQAICTTVRGGCSLLSTDWSQGCPGLGTVWRGIENEHATQFRVSVQNRKGKNGSLTAVAMSISRAPESWGSYLQAHV